jgi:hypothetical protein
MGDILRTLERRYGRVESDLAWSRVQMRQSRNRARLDVIDDQLSQLTIERRRLVEEDRRLEMAKELLADHIADRIRERHNEGWSPTPVVGYRLWHLTDEGVFGATGHHWERSVMDAECARARPDDDLPHTDHRCSGFGYGCGIYAASQPVLVKPDAPTGWILGVVLLSGKVVEHESGYRAAHARVAAVIAYSGDRLLVTADPDAVERLFLRAAATVVEEGEKRPAPNGTELVAALQDLERSTASWI